MLFDSSPQVTVRKVKLNQWLSKQRSSLRKVSMRSNQEWLFYESHYLVSNSNGARLHENGIIFKCKMHCLVRVVFLYTAVCRPASQEGVSGYHLSTWVKHLLSSIDNWQVEFQAVPHLVRLSYRYGKNRLNMFVVSGGTLIEWETHAYTHIWLMLPWHPRGGSPPITASSAKKAFITTVASVKVLTS